MLRLIPSVVLSRWLERLPIITWLPKYNFQDLYGDAVAGVTVALTVIPQGLALAGVAGLPPEYGLYTAFMGSFVYIIVGSAKDLTIGPTAIMCIMTSQYTKFGGTTYAVLLALLSGIVQLLLGNDRQVNLCFFDEEAANTAREPLRAHDSTLEKWSTQLVELQLYLGFF